MDGEPNQQDFVEMGWTPSVPTVPCSAWTNPFTFRKILILIKNMVPEGALMDIACGEGRNQHLPRQARILMSMGLDISIAGLEMARAWMEREKGFKDRFCAGRIIENYALRIIRPESSTIQLSAQDMIPLCQ